MKNLRKWRLILFSLITWFLAYTPFMALEARAANHGMEIKAYQFDYNMWAKGEALPNNAVVQPGDWIELDFHWQQGTISGPNGMEVHMKYDASNIAFDAGPVYCEMYNRPTTYQGGMWPSAADSPPPQQNVTNWALEGCNTVIQNNVGEFIAVIMDKGVTKRPLTKSGLMFSIYVKVIEGAAPGSKLDFVFESNPAKDPTILVPSTPLDFTNITLNVFGSSLSSDNSLSALTIQNEAGTISFPFDPALVPGTKPVDFTYSAIVPNSADKVNIAAVANDAAATVLPAGLGLKSVSVGDNVFSFSVVAGDGLIEIYQVKIKRLSSDATLASLALDGIPLEPDFHADTDTYQMSVPYSKNQTNVSGTPSATNATITSGLGVWDLNLIGASLNNRTITIAAENCQSEYISVPGNTCTTKEYHLKVGRENPSANNNLADLLVSEGSLSPAFAPDILAYNVVVDNEVRDINITALKEDAAATISGGGLQSLSVGDNEIQVVVTAEDGTPKTYTVTVRRKSSINKLTSLILSSDPIGSFSPAFHADSRTDYTYTIDPSVTSITVTGVLADASASFISASFAGETLPMTSGSATFTAITFDDFLIISTISENGEIATYEVKIIKAKSTNADLGSLTVSDGTLNPVFDKDTLNYQLTVQNAVDRITIGGTVAHADALVSGLGDYDLTVGQNPINIVVTSEAGNIKTYTIIVERLSLDHNFLNTLVVKSGTTPLPLNPDFNPAHNIYTLTVPNDTNNVQISATSDNAGAIINGVGTHNLIVGENLVELTVTSSEGLINTYKVIITRQQETDNNFLANLTVSEGVLMPIFNKHHLSYHLIVQNDVSTITVGGSAESAGALFSGLADYNLVVGENKIDVIVTSESGLERKYTITIERLSLDHSFLASLTAKISGVSQTLTPSFNSLINIYTVSVPSDTTSILIEATSSDDTAVITGLGSHDLTGVTTSIEVIVTNAAELENKYTLIVTKVDSDNTDLLSLVPSAGALSPAYNDDTDAYTIDVAGDVTEISFEVILADNKAAVIGHETIALQKGNNNITLIVTAEDGTIRTINITVYRSENVPIQGLEVAEDELVMALAETKVINLIFTPSDATNKSVTYSSSDENVATVVNGVITAVGYGSATITITSDENPDIS